MADIIYLDRRRQLKERIEAAKRMKGRAADRQRERINQLIGYAKATEKKDNDK